MTFADDALSYFDLWTAPFQPLKKFTWAALKKPPVWQNVEAVMNILSENNLYDAFGNATKLHTQFCYIKNYCAEDKIKKWNDDKASTVNRWVEIFEHFHNENCEYAEIATVIEYILCLPGTTASVERIFSAANKTWSEEKTRLQVETLKAILTVKTNMKFSCVEFFKLIKKKPQLLRQIASKGKYTTTTVSGEVIVIDDDSDQVDDEGDDAGN